MYFVFGSSSDRNLTDLMLLQRKVAPLHFASLDYSQFERSKQEANRLINALRKASREGMLVPDCRYRRCILKWILS